MIPSADLNRAREADAREHELRRGPRSQLPKIRYPVLSELQLAARWNVTPNTLRHWCAEGIGPPSWRIGKQPRYLESEIDAFERKAQVARKAVGGSSLSRSSPTALKEAIEWSAAFWPPAGERILLDCHEVSSITGLPTYWLAERSERSRLSVPHYVLGGKVIRFCIEQIFRWELDHLVPRGSSDLPSDA